MEWIVWLGGAAILFLVVCFCGGMLQELAAVLPQLFRDLRGLMEASALAKEDAHRIILACLVLRRFSLIFAALLAVLLRFLVGVGWWGVAPLSGALAASGFLLVQLGRRRMLRSDAQSGAGREFTRW